MIDAPLKNDTDHCCVVGDTLINTTNGYIKISDLVGKSGFVNTINPDTGEKVTCKFDNVVMTDEKSEIIEIEFENGEIIKLTENHPILTDRGWKDAGDLTELDNVITL